MSRNWRIQFINGILNYPCKTCNCQITESNVVFMKRNPIRVCRECYRETNKQKYGRVNHLKRYNMSIEDFDKMNLKQNCRCIICNNIPNKILQIDHDHKTGKIRELLCERCNLVLGQCNENIDLLIKMMNYIVKHLNLEKEFIFQHD